MNFSRFMHLFIFVLFSLFSAGKTDEYYVENSEENEYTNTPIMPSTTTESSELKGAIYDSDDYGEKWNTTETITSIQEATKYHSYSGDDDVDIYDDDESEMEDDTTSLTKLIRTTLSSPSTTSKIRMTTGVINGTDTSKSETPMVRSNWIYSSVPYDIGEKTLMTTTTDSEEIARLQVKANRDRRLLQNFVITVLIGMFSLSVALLIVHIVRKSRRYRGYDITGNASSTKQPTNVNNINV